MTIALYPPQQRAVEKMLRAFQTYRCTLQASATGTGKTLMNLQVAAGLGLTPLVVCPIAAMPSWARWSQELGIPVIDILNPEKLRIGKTPYVKVTGAGKKATYQWGLDPEKHMVIWDECHRGLTGKDAQTGRMAAMLRPQGIKAILTSATPPANPLNLRAIGYLMGLHQWSTGSFFSWCRAHGCTASPFHNGLEFRVESRSATAHLERINAAIRDRTVKLTIEDLAGAFPEGNIIEPLLVKLSDRSTEEANRIYADMDAEVKSNTHTNPLVFQLRARQKIELLKIPFLAESIEDLLEEEYSVFVSLCFCDSVTALLEELKRLGIEQAVSLTGSLSPKLREASVNMFNADLARVLVASPAGGESISLHRVNPEQRARTSLISVGFSSSSFLQSLGRIKRAGMLDPVVQRVVLADGTIESRIAKNLEAKLHAIDTVTDSDLI